MWLGRLCRAIDTRYSKIISTNTLLNEEIGQSGHKFILAAFYIGNVRLIIPFFLTPEVTVTGLYVQFFFQIQRDCQMNQAILGLVQNSIRYNWPFATFWAEYALCGSRKGIVLHKVYTNNVFPILIGITEQTVNVLA